MNPIFSVLICTIRAMAALQRALCNFSVFFVGLRQIVWSSLLVFSLDQVSSYSPRVPCCNASLMVAFAVPSICLSAVYLKSSSFHLPLLLFALHHFFASLATTSASLFPFIFVWPDIHWRWIGVPLVLRSSIHYVIFCMICGAEYPLRFSKTCSAV